ncbi:DUF5919 domain-containing protein [Streptosporangium sandarakinum]|uniref:DUF5919 domain-containing protein n=1 Tax=Streptosporangium sandarakinum TaxID=1260955 RepID=UPI003D90C8C1
MADRQVLLKTLLHQRHWQTYSTFCKEYDKAARSVDPALEGKRPSRAQLHRWLSGELKGLPYSDHCRVLEAMFPGRTAQELFSLSPNGTGTATPVVPAQPPNGTAQVAVNPMSQMADVTAVFSSRSAFAAAFPPTALFDDAQEIHAAGLSLNMLCQNYPDHQLKRLLENGTRIRCLFLDPEGSAIRAREQEENHPAGTLTTLTALNISVLSRLKAGLAAEPAERLEVHLYDETIRFNILIVDGRTCVVQPYLPQARGVDSPTFVMNDNTAANGLFPVFEQVFTSMWERSRPV